MARATEASRLESVIELLLKTEPDKLMGDTLGKLSQGDLCKIVIRLALKYKNREADSRALEDQLRTCAQMNDEVMTEYSKQETELKGQIAYLGAVADAAVERGNAIAELFRAEQRLHKADVAMSALGLQFTDGEQTET